MTFIILLICSTIAVFLLRNPIRSVPVLFYVLAIAVDVLFVFGDALGLPRAASHALFIIVHKCTLALALFAIVMFIGVFPKESRIRRWLQPIRAELSIIAWILSLGHMAMYLSAYASRMFSGVVGGAVLVALLVALALFLLLAVLGVTSFRRIKRRMDGVLWKRVQSLAYVFFRTRLCASDADAAASRLARGQHGTGFGGCIFPGVSGVCRCPSCARDGRQTRGKCRR